MCSGFSLVFTWEWMARSHSNFPFSVSRDCQTVYWSVCTILQSHQRCRRVPIPSPPWPTLIIADLLHPVILVGVRWCLTVLLISTFLLTGEAKHLFMCSLVILCVSWRTIYSDPWPILQLGCLSFHCGVVRVLFFIVLSMSHHVSRKRSGKVAKYFKHQRHYKHFDWLLVPCNLILGTVLVVGGIWRW